MAAGLAWFWFEQREQVRFRVELLVARGEDALAAGQDDRAFGPLSEARAILNNRPDLIELRSRIDRSLAKAEARVRLAKFLAMAAGADERILGGLWALLPHEDPEGRRRIKPREDGPSILDTGIAEAREALALYQFPEDTADVREPRNLDPDAAVRLRERVTETVFLLALAEERVGQGRVGREQRAQRERACQLLDVAEAMGNHMWCLYQHRARFRDGLGRAAEAEADRRRAEGTPASTFLDHHFKAVELDRERKRPAEAATEYRIALAVRPDDYWTLFRLAKLMERLKQLPQAELLFRNIVAFRPSDPTTHNALGTLLADQERNEEAIAEFEAASAPIRTTSWPTAT